MPAADSTTRQRFEDIIDMLRKAQQHDWRDHFTPQLPYALNPWVSWTRRFSAIARIAAAEGTDPVKLMVSTLARMSDQVLATYITELQGDAVVLLAKQERGDGERYAAEASDVARTLLYALYERAFRLGDGTLDDMIAQLGPEPMAKETLLSKVRTWFARATGADVDINDPHVTGG